MKFATLCNEAASYVVVQENTPLADNQGKLFSVQIILENDLMRSIIFIHFAKKLNLDV